MGRSSKVIAPLLAAAVALSACGDSGNSGFVGAPPVSPPVTDTTPNPFTFGDVFGAAPSTLIHSNPATISGINAPAPISVIGGEYAIDAGPFTTSAGTVDAGQSVVVRTLSSPADGTRVEARLEVGGVFAVFGVVTGTSGGGGGSDTTPDPFDFLDTAGAPGQQIATNTITVSGINAPAPVTVAGGEVSIDGGPFGGGGSVLAGQTVQARGLSSTTIGGVTFVTVTIGGVSDNFQIVSQDIVPDPFSFVDQTGLNGDTLATSAPVTITGLAAASPLSVVAGEVSIDGGAFSAAPTTVINGQTVAVRRNSSPDGNTTVSAVVTIGGVSDAFEVSTRAPLSELSFSGSTAVSSLDSTAQISPVWTLTFSDGGGDGFAPGLSALSFSLLSSSGVPSLGHLDRAELRQGTTTLATVTSPAGTSLNFTGFNQAVADGGSVVLTVWLRWSQGARGLDGLDGQSLELRLGAAAVTVANLRSQISSSQTDVDSGALAVAVETSRLTFVTQPPGAVTTNSDFGLTVQATDQNGNRDEDRSEQVALSATGGSSGGTLTSAGVTPQRNLSSGRVSWTDLRFDAADTISVQAAATINSSSLAASSQSVSVATPSGASPTISELTINDIPSGYYDGSGPFSGTLLAPSSGFTIDVDYSDPQGTPSGLVIRANQTVAGNSAGTDLYPLIPSFNVSLNGSVAVVLVPASLPFPSGVDTELSVQVRGATGLLSSAATLTIRAVTPTAANQPFEQDDIWYLWVGRDEHTPSVSGAGAVAYSRAGNGTSDWEEDLTLWGLRTSGASNGGRQTTGSTNLTINAAAENYVRNRILFHLARFYNQSPSFNTSSPGNLTSVSPFPVGTDPGIRVQFLFVDSAPGAPNALPGSVPATASVMAFGGGETIGALGRATVDPRNSSRTRNTAANQGTFTGTQLTISVISASDRLLPPPQNSTGRPIGSVADDADVLSPNVNPATFTGAKLARYNEVFAGLDAFAVFQAAVTAHEVGHSLGLVQTGAQPSGLFGGVNDTGSHVNCLSLSPFVGSGGQNLMRSVLGMAVSGNAATAFNPLVIAHMRNRILY